MTPDAPDQTAPTFACCHCGRTIDLCAFCERDVCPVASCDVCLRLAMGETLAHPHAHGG
jgi:hypothetical protein